MSPEFPPRPSKRTAVALAVVALVTFLYSVVVTAQILLWFVLVGVAIGLYLTYLLIVAVFRLVEAVERIATAAEVDSGMTTVAEARESVQTDDGDGTNDQSGDGTDDQSGDTDASGAPAAGGSTDDSAAGGSTNDSAAGASADDPDADGSALDGDAAARDDTPSTGPDGSDDAPELSPGERSEGG